MRNRVASLLLLGLIFVHPAKTIAQQPHHQKRPPSPTDTQKAVHGHWIQNTAVLSAGYRKYNLNWNITGTREGENPNVLSELNWCGIAIYQLKLTHRTVIKD